MRLSPETHRRTPAAPLGQDAVTALRREELDHKTVKDVWDEIPRWNKT